MPCVMFCRSTGQVGLGVGSWTSNLTNTGLIAVDVNYILSVYSPFSDRVGLPLHNIHIPSPITSI